MTRKFGIVIAVLTAMTLTVSIVAAGNAHFVGDPTISISGNTVTVSGKIAGLGNVDQIRTTVTGEAACTNPGSKKPQAANKQTVSASGVTPVQNGKANFGPLVLTATFQPDCTPPMTVSWTNVSIVVTDAVTGAFLLSYP
jgi:hypothetical protein